MKLRLQNFQGHSDSIVKSVPGITAITGTTNAGKSSFLRAFSHIHHNNLRGNGYIKHGADKCTVTIDNVQRIKSKSANQYIIDGNMTEALRSGVPHEVQTALNLSEDCIQIQHNSIFLIDKSAGQIAQKLSELIDLEIAHKSIKLVDTERRAAFAEVNSINTSVGKAQDRLAELKGIQEASDKLASIERKTATVNELEGTLASLQSAVKLAVERKLAIAAIPDVSKLTAGPKLKDEAIQVKTESTTISGIKDKIKAAKKWKTKQLSIPPTLLTSVASLKASINLIEEISEHLSILKTTKVMVTKHEEQLAVKTAEYKKLRGDRCPLCGEKYSKPKQ